MSFLYCGCALCDVDGDGIISLPEKLAETLGLGDAADLLLSTHESDRCLVGYARDHLEELRARTERWRLADEAAGHDARAHHLRARRVFGIVEAAPRTANGLRIPAAMRHLGRIGAVALLVGTGERFEIWNPDLAVASDDPQFRDVVAYQLKIHRRRAPRGGTRRARAAAKGGR